MRLLEAGPAAVADHSICLVGMLLRVTLRTGGVSTCLHELLGCSLPLGLARSEQGFLQFLPNRHLLGRSWGSAAAGVSPVMLQTPQAVIWAEPHSYFALVPP